MTPPTERSLERLLPGPCAMKALRAIGRGLAALLGIGFVSAPTST
jgi:hypothetical protein